MSSFVGIDIAKDKFDAVLWRAGHSPERAQFVNDRAGFNKLHHFLQKRQAASALICMEATGLYYEALAEFLHQKGYPVSVVNPAQIKAYAQSQLRRNKTDQLDADIIADFCRTQNPPLWTPPTPAEYELRALLRHLEDLEADRQRQHNRLHALQHSAQPAPTVVGDLQQQIVLLTEQIERVKKQIQGHIDQHPDLKRQRDLLQTIKGFGPLTAAKLLVEYRGFTHFGDVRQVVAFAGLNPKQRQSGSSIHGRTHISKMGRSSIRAALYMPAINAKRFNPLLQPFVRRLEEQGLCGMEIIVAVMRKLLHLAFGILKSGQPFDPYYLEKQAAMA